MHEAPKKWRIDLGVCLKPQFKTNDKSQSLKEKGGYINMMEPPNYSSSCPLVQNTKCNIVFVYFAEFMQSSCSTAKVI